VVEIGGLFGVLRETAFGNYLGSSVVVDANTAFTLCSYLYPQHFD
jgi:hypothetical protein